MTKAENSIRIGLVEDLLLFRKGIKAILESSPELEVVFESEDGFSVLEKLQNATVLPDVLLVDLSLPPLDNQEFSGIEVTTTVREHFPEIRILILSVHDDEQFITQLIQHGAHGYLVKDCDPKEVHEAVRTVYHKGSYINKRTLEAIQSSYANEQTIRKNSSQPPISFTRREEEIIQLICHELTSEEIGEKLFISAKTVNGHRNNLLQKTGARNTAGLVIYAIKNGLATI